VPPRASSGDARSAASRLKHDLGKYARWSAPEERESDSEELRARLGRDLLATRLVDGVPFTAVQVFEAWRAEDGAALEGVAALAEVEDAVRRVGSLLPGLATLERAGLAALDDAALRLATACTAVFREVVRREEGS
jgi:hypothetical protein